MNRTMQLRGRSRRTLPDRMMTPADRAAAWNKKPGSRTVTAGLVACFMLLIGGIGGLIYVSLPRPVSEVDLLVAAYCVSTFRDLPDCSVDASRKQATVYRWNTPPKIVLRDVSDGVDEDLRTVLEPILREHLDAAGFQDVPIETSPPLTRDGTIDIRFPPWGFMGSDLQDKTRRMRWGHNSGAITFVELSLNANLILDKARRETSRSLAQHLTFEAHAIAAQVLGRLSSRRPAFRTLAFPDGTIALELALTGLHYDKALPTGTVDSAYIDTLQALAETLMFAPSLTAWREQRSAGD